MPLASVRTRLLPWEQDNDFTCEAPFESRLRIPLFDRPPPGAEAVPNVALSGPVAKAAMAMRASHDEAPNDRSGARRRERGTARGYDRRTPRGEASVSGIASDPLNSI